MMSEFENIEDRLDNWGFTVRSPKYQSGVCAQWAQMYIAIRDKAEMPASVTPVEKDGWLIEAAWARMPDHVAKWVLKYTYVWRMSPDQVQTRIRKRHGAALRGRRFELVLEDAHAAISRAIVALSASSIIDEARKYSCASERSVI